jgi:hypothetical protein
MPVVGLLLLFKLFIQNFTYIYRVCSNSVQ